MAVIDISNTAIYLVCNEDVRLMTLLVSSLFSKGAANIHLLISDQQAQYFERDELIGVNIIKGTWEETADFEPVIANAVIVISMLYHDFEKQQKLFSACVRQNVILFVTWDSGMELDHLVRDHSCPRTQLHQRLLEYTSQTADRIHPYFIPPRSSASYHFPHLPADKMQWILFQVGIFDDEVLKHDISTVTTAFNSPNQFIFINVSVKSDFADIVAATIVNKRARPNRNYVVGEFVSHAFLGHVYKVINQDLEYDSTMPCEITEFETTNQLRISEISFQHGAIIYKMLANHRRVTLREWVLQKI
ncbi:10820_t:CDS:2, partial [Acaulospora morrowiae]